MFSGTFSIVYLVLAIAFCVYLCQYIARKKGRDPAYWAFMGGLFGPLAIPVILLIKSKKTNSE